MKRRLKLVLLTLAGVCSMFVQNAWGGKNGQHVIDFVRFDYQSNSVVFTSTNWSDGACSTELYTYQIELDSLYIDTNWASCDEFDQNKDEIMENRGLSNLASLPSVDIPYFVAFRWDQPVKYFSVRRNENTYNRPFTLTILKQEYNYYQCSGESNEPNIIHLKIDGNSGLVFINFQGDCSEGNWRDSIIYYYREEGRSFTRKLTPNDVLPIDIYKTASAETWP